MEFAEEAQTGVRITVYKSFPPCHVGRGRQLILAQSRWKLAKGRWGGPSALPTSLCWQARSPTGPNVSVHRVARWGSLPSPGEPPLPGSPRGAAWSEDTEVNTEVLGMPQKHCQPPGVLRLPASSHLSRQLHLEKVLITPCSKPWTPWQGIKHPTLLCKRGGNLSDL